jgi:hypothetical protein
LVFTNYKRENKKNEKLGENNYHDWFEERDFFIKGNVGLDWFFY